MKKLAPRLFVTGWVKQNYFSEDQVTYKYITKDRIWPSKLTMHSNSINTSRLEKTICQSMKRWHSAFIRTFELFKMGLC